MVVCQPTGESASDYLDSFCKKSANGITPLIRCAESLASGKMRAVFISGKRFITTSPGCLFQCATSTRVSKLAKCDCHSLRREACVTAGSLHPPCHTELVPAAHCISI